ncbi:tetratricopeptide repeat domain protein [Nautilia profundicola AmH]|uniref:Tetratricopeptide repeat domain protein n=1 Tax=Nautilia profundicola (strain ATCC BAA-1463 / DSM 18972 / AmH) TaxID=598659 RepID=B9L617_NAUPA|nr:tetratricopeptide repeat protein [Nautilia profundicola]ACM93138.1 tetratricopeptide repeat domain protein [Nautilia profundicola AmH]
MKFFLLLFFFVNLFGLEINVDYFKNNTSYEILTITNEQPFTCIKKNQQSVECYFDKSPSTPVFKTSTIFFNIKPQFKDNNFSILFNIKTHFLLKSFEDNLLNNATIGINPKKAKKWVIIAGKNTPFIETDNNRQGLDFYYINSPKPFIGTIDENGNPININNQAKDVIKYFEIKKAYEKGRDVLDEIDQFVKDYPNSVFVPDVEFLKLKILDSENKPEEVITLAKKWIKQFAFNENLPKVLLIIAKNYTKLGFMTDASYFYQRIITEYPNTKEAYLAMIYWADQMYITGDSKKAFELYKKALYSTKDVDIASLAALRLAQRYMDKGDIKTAFEYYKRVYQANKDFILKDKKKAFELAKMLASHQLYSLAIDIGEDLIKRLKKLDDLYEPLEYYLALWSYDAGDFKKADYWINKYLNEFPYGDYSDQLKSLRDKVLFEVSDGNVTEQLKKIDEIIEKYKGQDIANKALYKKVMLLYKLKKYDEILKMSDEIKKIDDKYMKNKEEFLKEVAKKYAIELLTNKKCLKAVEIIKKYKLALDKKYDLDIYKCAINTRNYDLASVVCNKYLNSPDDKVFVEWMKRKITALEGLGDYNGIVMSVDDLCQVMKKGCYDYQLKKFFALWKLKRYKAALKVAKILETKSDIRNTDAFIKIVNWALQNNDTLMAAQFAKKIIDLQNRFKAYPYSPFVEFTYAKYTKNKKDAIKVLQNLLPRVKGEDKARALYMLANLTGEKKYIQQCVKIKDSKLWKGLCKDALDLF